MEIEIKIKEIFFRAIPIREKIYCGKAHNLIIGEHSSRLVGSDEDVRKIAEWEPGEPIDDIDFESSLPDWPQKIFLTERFAIKEAPVIFVTDASPSIFVEISSKTGKFKLMLTILVSLGLGADEIRDPVGCLSHSDEVNFYLEPRPGSGWISYVVELLLGEAEKFENLKRQKSAVPKTNLNEAFNFLINHLRRQQCAIVVLSDFADIISGQSQLNFDLLETLSSVHNWNLIAIFLDEPDEFLWKHKSGTVVVRDAETGVVEEVRSKGAAVIRRKFIEKREELRKKLEKVGVDSTVISYGDHFNQLANFLSERQAAYR